MNPYQPYVPETPGEMMDLLAHLMLSAPTFVDKTGFFWEQNIETEFLSLTEGLKAIRKQIGDDGYEVLADLATRMRAHFEADPEETNGEAKKGYACIREMEELLPKLARRRPKGR